MTGKLDDPSDRCRIMSMIKHGWPRHRWFRHFYEANKPEFEPTWKVSTAVAQQLVMVLGRRSPADAGTGAANARGTGALQRRGHLTYQQFKEIVDRSPQANQTSADGAACRMACRNRQQCRWLSDTPGGLSPAQQEIERDPAACTRSRRSQYRPRFQRNSRHWRRRRPPVAGGSGPHQGNAGRSPTFQHRLRHQRRERRRRAGFNVGYRQGITGWEKQSPNLSGADAAQAFSKLGALVGAARAPGARRARRAGQL